MGCVVPAASNGSPQPQMEQAKTGEKFNVKNTNKMLNDRVIFSPLDQSNLIKPRARTWIDRESF
jgi:hypothetical protein